MYGSFSVLDTCILISKLHNQFDNDKGQKERAKAKVGMGFNLVMTQNIPTTKTIQLSCLFFLVGLYVMDTECTGCPQKFGLDPSFKK